jgi:hypothetical protein
VENAYANQPFVEASAILLYATSKTYLPCGARVPTSPLTFSNIFFSVRFVKDGGRYPWLQIRN